MRILRAADLNRTLYYLRRNGLKSTWYAARERLEERRREPYLFQNPSSEELEEQRRRILKQAQEGTYDGIRFSIVVPTYHTPEIYLRELLDCLRAQTYPFWEVILADATEDDSVRKMVEGLEGIERIERIEGIERTEKMEREPDTIPAESSKAELPKAENRKAETYQAGGSIRYFHLEKNAGISANTNFGLAEAAMEYTGLLDHDDVLTPDALFHMAEAIRQAREEGVELQLLYSDEDKCNADQSLYYEPNFKEDFNPDLLLSNNYICHFLVMKTELIKRLGFRTEYDGAQDYDLVLRAATVLNVFENRTALSIAAKANGTGGGTASCTTKRDKSGVSDGERLICHIPRVLYHWRCHAASTAENPKSKEYAYTAGQRALQDFAGKQGWKAKAVAVKHVGFYRLQYGKRDTLEDIFLQRKDVGVIGSAIYEKNRLTAGRMDLDGTVFYKGLCRGYSGYLHRAVLTQDAAAVDIRCMCVRPELRELFEQTVGVPYREKEKGDFWDSSVLPADADYIHLSLRWCEAVRKRGYRILYKPVEGS